jgi:hypothetical protein
LARCSDYDCLLRVRRCPDTINHGETKARAIELFNNNDSINNDSSLLCYIRLVVIYGIRDYRYRSLGNLISSREAEMKISFDLDGVIAETDKWFFRMLNVFHELRHESQELYLMEMNYYANRPLKYHPNFFLADGDEGFIITARKQRARHETERWLSNHGIELKVVFIDGNDDIDWLDYPRASKRAGVYKANTVKSLGVDCHFDNNPYIVQEMRRLLAGVKVIQIGGERGE